ncbi:DUF2975 domain-containing protein [Galbibacter pacificus]|uniref:DUF2975 domain-containing protein n=1 Tax=Galbibacter pacificus TaxID=2996052 RepID=A0ABT6FT28_9FLAO|nr:DUF2975 domain-containing protein [Galbibacter pacificus]MDG3582630.1 DUF2975 domain-containing protein [Galbibacter pacificus]MDG3586251.1 DUF2975 domain-containing protein [Galbibacter pacificus]
MVKQISNILHIMLLVFQIFIFFLTIGEIIHFAEKFDKIHNDYFFGIHLSESDTPLTHIIVFCITILVMSLLFYLLNLFRKVILDFRKEFVFTEKNGKQLRKIAFGLIIIGLTILTVFLIFFPYKTNYEISNANDNTIRWVYNLGLFVGKLTSLLFPIFIPALFFMLISKLIKEGNIIKTENDLTI